MASPIPERKRWHWQVEAEIQDGLVWQQPAARIYEELLNKFALERKIQIPSDSAIRRRVRHERERRREQWQPSGALSDGAVMDTFVQIATRYPSISVLSKPQGEALARVLHLAPDLPSAVAWEFAHVYSYAGDKGEHLDFALGVARQVKEINRNKYTGEPILGLDGDDTPRPTVETHVRIHRKRWPERPFCAWAGGPETWTSYVQALGFPFFESEDETRRIHFDNETWWLWTASAWPPEKRGVTS
jgi:hypothetical protein